MPTRWIQDHGRGPEIEGTRILIDDLIPHFFEPDVTESSICRRYDLMPEQVAAARAYILDRPEVLNRHIQQRDMSPPENPREVIDKAEQTRVALLSFKGWLARREALEASGQDPGGNGARSMPQGLPSFKQWLAEEEARSGGAS